MEKKSSCARAGFSTILWGVLAILLCAVPCGARTVASGDTLNVGTGKDVEGIDDDWLDVYGTVNLYAGAYVDGGLYAHPGSTVNIYAGAIGDGLYFGITVSPDEPNAVVTVYGTDFAVDGVTLDPIPDQVTFTGGSGTLSVTYDDGTSADLLFYSDIPIYLAAPAIAVDIDIKPGSYPNSINLGSNGVIPVAILSTADFDATTVLPETVSLAGSGVAVRGKGNKLLAHEEDVNGDGLTDLVVKVETENLDPGTFQDGLATLTGQTSDGVQFEGSDEISIVPAE